jgi:Mn-dependent DtxR family transcriptional regulator
MISDNADTWRSFDFESITHTEAHYLMALYKLETDFGYARLGDISDLLSVGEGDVLSNLASLRRGGYVEQNLSNLIRLSPLGREKAASVYRDRELLSRFFSEVLGVGSKEASLGACRIEHLIGPRVSTAIREFLQFIDSEAPGAVELREGLTKYLGNKSPKR